MNATETVIRSRHSVRAFRDTPVPQQTVRELLETAAYAPSGSNSQPWKVYVVSGSVRDTVVREVSAIVDTIRENPAIAENYSEAFPYYPEKWVTPYLERRRENGWGLYGTLGIAKGERDKMHAQNLRNYCFFDAPVGLFFTVERVMGEGARMDTAMMMQNFALAARSRGLDTCIQAAWNAFHSVIFPLIGAGDEILVGTVALGYADENHIANSFKTPRIAVDAFTRWL